MAPLGFTGEQFARVVRLCEHVRVANWSPSIDLRAFLSLRALAMDPDLANRLLKLSDAELIALTVAIEKAQSKLELNVVPNVEK